jgi:hypothetical protein
MFDRTEIATFAALGVVFAIGVALLARWAKQKPGRIAAYALIVFSFLYVGLAFGSEAPNSWVAIEMTGVAIFASAAFVSLMTTPWVVVAGLPLQALWVFYIHVKGTGQMFTPAPLGYANIGFDVALALHVGFVTWRARRGDTSAKVDRKSQKERAQ